MIATDLLFPLQIHLPRPIVLFARPYHTILEIMLSLRLTLNTRILSLKKLNYLVLLVPTTEMYEHKDGAVFEHKRPQLRPIDVSVALELLHTLIFIPQKRTLNMLVIGCDLYV